MGMGMGMGFGVGNTMTNMFGQAMNQQQTGNAPNTQPPPLPASSAYYAAINGQQSGPFTIDVINNMIKQGSMQRTTLVWKQGMSGWQTAETVTEIGSLFAQVPPPLPPV